MLQKLTLQSKPIYTLSCFTTTGSKLRYLQNKFLDNTLHLSQKLFYFANTILGFAHFVIEKMKQLFIVLFTCKTKPLWCTVIEYFKRNFHILLLLPQSAILCFLEADDKVFLIINKVLLLFKKYIYFSKVINFFFFKSLLKPIMKVYKLEKTKFKVMKRKENYLRENGKQFFKICKSLKKYELLFF